MSKGKGAVGASVFDRDPTERVDHRTIYEGLAELNRGLHDVNVKIGDPDNGAGQPATGLFAQIDNIDARLLTFEKLRERVKGALFIAIPFGAGVWWLVGEKMGQLFHH